jgi:parallel beta-helix repeat protein
MHLRSLLFAALTLAGSAWGAAAADHYVAPLGKAVSCKAAGTQACPWASIWDAINSGKFVGGDTLLLMDGNYSGLKLYQVAFDTPVTIQSLNGKNARLEWINLIDGTKNITFRNLSVWPTDPTLKLGDLVVANPKTSGITVDGLDVRSGADAGDYLKWSASGWTSRSNSGINLGGPNSIVRNSSVLGVSFGITTGGPDSQIVNNRVEGYSGDALRAFGDRSLVKGNTALNAVTINENHTDGFQSWADADGVLDSLTIEGNTIIEWNAAKDHPLHGRMQGIGLFDGPYSNVIIRNNIVAVSFYHGISIYGGRNVQIANNTVVNNDGVNTTSPYIGVFAHKNGTPAENVVVSNNVAMSFNSSSNSNRSVSYVNNSVVLNLAQAFEDVTTFNYRPKAASGFIDTGNASYAPLIDILGAARPAGAGPDRGAYEIGGTGGSTGEPPTDDTGSGTGSGGDTTGGDTTGGDGSGTGGDTTTSPKSGAKFVKAVKKKITGTATATP